MEDVKRKDRKNIVYLLIGVLTLIITTTGATFAYFTATDEDDGTITGNMATVQLSLAVEKVVKADETEGGMIPMSNGMVESAINDSNNAVCVDDNGNAVCQVYKITITNSSSAGQFVDGYVSLRYGSGAPVDYTTDIGTYVPGAKFVNATKAADTTNGVGTTMRWAQVFVGDGTAATNNATSADYSTAGTQILGTSTEKVSLSSIGYAVNAASQDPHSKKDIKDDYTLTTASGSQGVLSNISIAGSNYDVIGTNYIRVSNHNWTADATGGQTYTRQNDVSSALVFNHSIAAGSNATYYIVVWLSETGADQTANHVVGSVTNPDELNFFDGNVTFISAQGSEVSATFTGYTRVSSQQ